MNRMEAFEIWAPASGIWSKWARPVVFAHMRFASLIEADPGLALETIDVAEADGKTALVADLPAQAGVSVGMAMAHQGFRPVPLYNAVPAPRGVLAAVDVDPIIQALMRATKDIQSLRLRDDAPPIFLLDSLRRGGRALGPGDFDNRSLSLPTDFPSAILMRSRGIERVVLLRETRGSLAEDLAHTLRRWQDGGIAVFEWSMLERGKPQPVQVQRPSWFRFMFQRALATLGYRRNVFGGFGGVLPQPSAG